MPIPLSAPALAAALLLGITSAADALPSAQLQDLRGPAGSPAAAQDASSAADAALGNAVHGRPSSSAGDAVRGGRASSSATPGVHGGTSTAASTDVHGAPSTSARPRPRGPEIRAFVPLLDEILEEQIAEDRKPRTTDGGLKTEKDAAAEPAHGGASSTIQGG